MKIGCRYIISIVLGLLTALVADAQKLQTLPADPAVKKGVLPNGTNYYIVSNPSAKGMADFALVQKTGANTVPGVSEVKALQVAQEALDASPRLLSGSVQSYFVSLGVVPDRDGFVKVSDNATVFRFNDVMLSQRADQMDSTLVIMLDMVDRANVTEDPFIRQWYAPSDQALIIAGDVDPKSIVEKLKVMSYMTVASPSSARQEYTWKNQDSVRYEAAQDTSSALSYLSFRWRLQRTPKEFINTVQPAIYERFLSELGIVAGKRISDRLHEMDIPVAGISYDYVNSIESLSDESFSLSLYVRPEHAAVAVGTVASVLSSLDAGNATARELRRAERIYLEEMSAESSRPRSNAEYVDICIASFMYNATLATEKDKYAFHISRAVQDSTELKLFSNIAAATLDDARNLTLTCSAGLDAVTLQECFMKGWAEGHADAPPAAVASQLNLPGPSAKVKVKSSKAETLSGGTVWTLSNKLKVIFKKTPLKDRVFYSLSLNGGYGSIKDLAAGEGAYMSEYLDMCRIRGLDSDSFKDVLRKADMSFRCKVNLSNTIITGQVPADSLAYLLRVLQCVMYDRETDEEAFADYRADDSLRMELMKGTVMERIAAIDSIICPGYRYSDCKAEGRLTETFAGKADAFFKAQAEKMNDGALILVGDIDEVALKKTLMAYAGGFRTTDKAFSRPVVRYQPISGTATYTVKGKENSVDIVLSVPMALSADNYYTAEIASMALRKAMSRSLMGTGMSLKVNHVFRMYPQERLNVMISLNEASVDGYLPGTAHLDPLEALRIVRTALSDLSSVEISKSELASYKAMLKKRIALDKNTPEYWLGAITKRYLDSKDFSTGSDAKIDAVTKENVISLLTGLDDGCKVEYIIRRQ